jgi:thioredoxin 1
MKKTIGLFSILFLLLAFVYPTQTNKFQDDEGITFESLSLAAAKEKAKETGKVIFIDAYTSWCGPCKKMAAISFKDESVAKTFNKKFINIKVEMEQDPDGDEIARFYRVRAYPTLLFIDAEGNLVKSVIGFQTADRLLTIANSL